MKATSRSYKATQETLALLKILALGKRQVYEGKAIPLSEVSRRLRARRKKVSS